MQGPPIHRLNDLQLGFNSLQNPFLSHITSSLPGVHSVSVAYNFCKWGAVILALVATFSSIIKRVTIFIVKFRRKASSLPSTPHLLDDDDDDYSSSDDDESYSSSEFEDDDDEPTSSSSFRKVGKYFGARRARHHVDDQFQSCNGSLLRRRLSIGEIFSLSEIANSKSVVKLWDSIGFGLGLDFDDSDSSSDDGILSVFDINKEHGISSITGRNPNLPAISSASPAVVVSAGENSSGNLALKIWDTRLRRRNPTVIAEWGPTLGNTVSVESDGVQKIYVRDDGRHGVVVGDMRKASSPLGKVTESDKDTWWDADALIFSDEPYGDDQSVLQPT